MNSSLNLKRIHIAQQKIKFLANLTLNPKFYRVIGDVLSDPEKLDLTLGTMCYAALFMGSFIKRFPSFKGLILRLYGDILITLNKAIIFLSSKFQRDNLGKKLTFKPIYQNKITETTEEDSWSKLSKTLLSFSGYLTDIRIFNRGFSIPACMVDILESGALLSNRNYVDWFSTLCISLYQPLETIAFLFDHNWLLPDRESNNCLWWYAVSTRFWFVWVIAEFSKLAYKILKSRGEGIDNSDLVKFIEHLATLPLCVHWSLEEGCLDPIFVGFFGTIAGGLSTTIIWKDAWKKIVNDFVPALKKSIESN